MSAPVTFQKTMQMGLGEAINRMLLLSAKAKNGIASSIEKDEYKLILDALNQTKLDLGFDCDLDGVPDTLAIFAQSAATSCCRILDIKDTSRKTKPKPKTPKKRPTSRRRKK